MKKTIFLFVLLLPVITFAQLDLKVIQADEARSLNIPERFINANGKALIKEKYYHKLQENKVSRDDLDEIDGWPVLGLPGTTQRASRFIDINLDNEPEFIFATGNVINVYDHKGNILEGWPVIVSNDPIEGTPSVGNVDSDPELEIVVHVTFYGIRGELRVYDHDGTLKPGFPIIWPDGGPQKEPLLENTDEDPEMEIFSHIYNYPTSYLYVHNGDGTQVPDWENIELDYIPGSGCSSGDITGDGVPEIIACTYWKLYAFNLKGDVLDGFPFTFEQEIRGVSYSNPVIADINEDGFNEIAVATVNEQPETDAGAVYVLKNDGTLVDGWPQYTLRWMYAPLSVLDFDQDGHLDILVGDQVLSPYPDDYLLAWDKDGNDLPGFPVGGLDAINVQGMVSDLDNDGDLEIIVDNNSTGSPYQIFHHDGSEFIGFLLNPSGATFFNTVLLDDINEDGNLNIVAPTVDLGLFTTDMHIYDAAVPYIKELTPLGHHQYNSRNTGEYGLYDPVVGVDEINQDEATIIEVFPNPFDDHITLCGLDNLTGNITFELYNTQGQCILSKSIEAGRQVYLDLMPELSKGIYIYKVNTSQSSISGKLVH